MCFSVVSVNSGNSNCETPAGTRNMVQQAKCLLRKHEFSSSSFQNLFKSQMGIIVSNPCMLEDLFAGDPWNKVD